MSDNDKKNKNNINPENSDKDTLWGEAMDEQKKADETHAENENRNDENTTQNTQTEVNTSPDDKSGEGITPTTQDPVFEALEPKQINNPAHDINLILDIPVHMTVELGRTRLTIKELLNLTQGSIVALEGLSGEPLDILINGYLIAQGEVVVVGDKYGIRITDIITPSERMRRLSQ